jgi:hypothetical protein
MKDCKVKIGPIIDAGGVLRKEGTAIQIVDATADLFASWRFVEIIPALVIPTSG